MDGFNKLINHIGLIDVGYRGKSYTWNNNRIGLAQVRERLDRSLVNSVWMAKYPKSQVFHEVMIGSNHCPIRVTISLEERKGPKVFKFEEMCAKESIWKDLGTK